MKLLFRGPEDLQPSFSADTVAAIYNALDCAITLEVLKEIKPQLQGQDLHTYNLTRSYQAPALDMMLRGWKVDLTRKRELLEKTEASREDLFSFLQQIGAAIGLPLRPKTKAIPYSHYINHASSKQVKELFYDIMKLPPIRIFDRVKKESVVSANRESLEKLAERNFSAKPLVSLILTLRDLSKTVGFLRTGVDSDNRMRFSFNIAGTETGRWASRKSAWGSGTNAQNITPDLREIFIADPGFKLCYMDLEQAESRLVGLLAPGFAYWNACHSGDLHTTVCKLIWKNLPWPNEAKADKALAETIFYRHFTHRDYAKRGGHGTNYYGKPPQMAKTLHVELSVMEDFQQSYFAAFPEIRQWHLDTKRRLQLDRYLITPFGRKRYFHGRPDDDATLREAIANVPQSSIAEYLNIGLREVWRREPRAQLLAQIHDAIVFQYPEGEEDTISRVAELLRLSVSYEGKTLVIPSEAKVGWNWGQASASNPDGLVKWKAPGSDKRVRTSLLDRVLR